MQALLQAAAQVFELRGYAAATTNRIAERAGVSIGSLYQYFPNKDAILVALVREHVTQSAAVLQPHIERLNGDERFDDVLPDVVGAMVAMHARAPGLHRVLFEETPLPSPLRAELDELEAWPNVATEAIAREITDLVRAYLDARGAKAPSM